MADEEPQNMLERVVKQIFEDMLSLDVEDAGTPEGPPLDTPWLARVGLDGGWHGYLDLVGDEDFLVQTAGILLGISPTQLSIEDRDDAWGEIGNLLAGNILDELPPNVRLSRPAVRPLTPPIDVGEPLDSRWFLVEGCPVAVLLYSGAPAAQTVLEPT